MNDADCSGLNEITDDEWRIILLNIRKYCKIKCTVLPADVEPDDIACEAIKRVLEGTRNWNREKCPDLLKHLQGTVDSIVSKIWKLRHNRARMGESHGVTNLDKLEEYSEEMPSEPNADYFETRLEQLREITKGDSDLEYFFLAIECGAKSFQELARVLDWEIAKVYTVKRRLMEKIQIMANHRAVDDE